MKVNQKLYEKYLTTRAAIPLITFKRARSLPDILKEVGLSNTTLEKALMGSGTHEQVNALTKLNINYDAYIKGDCYNIYITPVTEISLKSVKDLINFLAFDYGLSLVTFFQDYPFDVYDAEKEAEIYRRSRNNPPRKFTEGVNYMVARVNEHGDYCIEQQSDGSFLVIIDKGYHLESTKVKELESETYQRKTEEKRELSDSKEPPIEEPSIAATRRVVESEDPVRHLESAIVAVLNKYPTLKDQEGFNISVMMDRVKAEVKRVSIREWDKDEFRNKLGTLKIGTNERENFYNRKYIYETDGIVWLETGALTPIEANNKNTKFRFTKQSGGYRDLTDIKGLIIDGSLIPLKREDEE